MSLNENNEINEGKSVAEGKEEVRKFATGGSGRQSGVGIDCPPGTHWDQDERKCMINEMIYAKSGGRAKSIARSAPSRAPSRAPAPRTLSGGNRGGGLM